MNRFLMRSCPKWLRQAVSGSRVAFKQASNPVTGGAPSDLTFFWVHRAQEYSVVLLDKCIEKFRRILLSFRQKSTPSTKAHHFVMFREERRRANKSRATQGQ